MKTITRIVQEKEFKDLDENRTREIVWGGHYLVSIHDINENNVELSVFVGEEIYDPIPFPDVIKHVTEFICKKLEGKLIYAEEEYVLDDSLMIALKKKISPKFIQAHVTKVYGKDLINARVQNFTYIDETGKATMIFFIVQGYISENSIQFTITSPGLEKLGNKEVLEDSIFKYVTQDITRYKKFIKNGFKVFCNNIQIL